MSVTRTVFASPVFWLLGASFLAGRAMGNVDAIVWLFVSPWPIAAVIAYALERWYLPPRAARLIAERWAHEYRAVAGRVE